ncbi:MAG: DUF89 family protein [Melioribacteraceae bacterium]|nr:DUF89 family protein [Melioribacteraceae bacterium]
MQNKNNIAGKKLNATYNCINAISPKELFDYSLIKNRKYGTSLVVIRILNTGELMFFDPACIPCIINQAHKTALLFTNGNKDLQLSILKKVCREVEKVGDECTAPQFSRTLQEIVEESLGIFNPYKEIKEKNLAAAKNYIPFLQSPLNNINDKIEIAVRIAIAGNIIDIGANPGFNLEDEISRITSNNIDLLMLPKFKRDLEKAESILYIGDNYEEALFDKFLLNELRPKKVVFAVRSKPILNDITLEDAYRLEIDKICDVMESGSKIAGTDLNACTDEFMKVYKNADMVIAKGQGNYETLINAERPIYFLFKVKCDAIAAKSGYRKGMGVLLYKRRINEV